MVEKTEFLQIRVSPAQKRALRLMARNARMDMSECVLARVFSSKGPVWDKLTRRLASSRQPAFVLSEVNDYLSDLAASEFPEACSQPPPPRLDPYLANYLAAMVEYAAHQKEIVAPDWTCNIAPLDTPVFTSGLKSLKLHLLTHTPPPFRRRNIFIDTTVGGRV